MKVLLFLNNISWNAEDRIKEVEKTLTKRLSPIRSSVEISCAHSSWPIKHNGEYIDSEWFLNNFTQGSYDAYGMVIDRKDWKGKETLLGHYIRANKKINFYVIAGEKQKVKRGDGKKYLVLEDTLEHELCGHGMYQDMGAFKKPSLIDKLYVYKFDNTHHFWEKHNLVGLYTDLYKLWAEKEGEIIQDIEKIKQLIKNLIDDTSMNELYERAKSLLGTDVSPQDLVSDSFACAETVSTLINSLNPNFPRVTGTWSLWDLLKVHADQVQVPQAGDIILSVTGTGNGAIRNGHCGVVGEHEIIMSNDSLTGLFKENYTLDSWNNYYGVKGGFPVLFYRLK